MLKKPCPYHQGPVKHTLKECTMLRRYYAKLGLPNDEAKKKDAGDRDNNRDDRFPEVHNAFMIFSGPFSMPHGATVKEGAQGGLLG